MCFERELSAVECRREGSCGARALPGEIDERACVRMLKRLFDMAVATVGLILVLPVLIALAVVIKLTSNGPVLYRGVRVGLGGRRFRMSKFRTMVVDADLIGGPSTSACDSRITRIGRFARKYKLDELPQLFDVLRGEMSLVGPRPEVPQYAELYRDEEKAILSVRPGITDWATLWNPDEGDVLARSADPERTYLEKIRPHKIRWQLEYVRRRSFWIDLQILSQTLVVIIGRRKPKALEPLEHPAQSGR